MHLVEEPDTPLLQCLGQQGVVRIRESAGDDRPCLDPKACLVDVCSSAHEFHHARAPGGCR